VSPGGLAPDLTVRANVRYVLALCGQRASGTQVEAALRRADLPDRCVDRPAAALRPRETVSVWLALARLRRTPVLLCERVADALDTLEAGRVAALLRDCSAHGHAVLVTTRAPLFARAVADRCGTLEQGRMSVETERTRTAGRSNGLAHDGSHEW
jgi:ABC-type ATPase involved in cell division